MGGWGVRNVGANPHTTLDVGIIFTGIIFTGIFLVGLFSHTIYRHSWGYCKNALFASSPKCTLTKPILALAERKRETLLGNNVHNCCLGVCHALFSQTEPLEVFASLLFFMVSDQVSLSLSLSLPLSLFAELASSRLSLNPAKDTPFDQGLV